MPEMLDRCVRHVLDNPEFEPRDPSQSRESAAFAVCRASLGLREDGDDPEIDDEEMKRRVTERLGTMLQDRFMAGPVLVRDFELAREGTNFRNGPDEFDLTRSNLEEIVRNFRAFRRLVPVYLVDTHPKIGGAQRSAAPADGWVEDLWIDGRLLKARVKVHGRAAMGFLNDEYRGISIGAFTGKDPHGEPAGDILDHLLITNTPFFNDLNARIAASSGAAYIYLTSHKEADMADAKDKDGKAKDAPPATDVKTLTEEIAALKGLIEAKDKALQEAETARKNLTEENDTLRQTPAIEQLMKDNEQLKRGRTADQIRRKLASMIEHGQLRKDEHLDMHKHPSDEVVLSWFKEGFCKGSMDRLDIAMEMKEKKPLGRRYATGDPGEGSEPTVTLTQDEIDFIRKRGLTPEKVAAISSVQNFAEYKAKFGTKDK